MKRKLIYLSLLIGVVATTTSCEGFLDREPSGAVTSEGAIESYADAVTVLNGVYDGLQGSSDKVDYYGARMVYYGDVRGDYMQAATAGKRTSGTYEMNYNADNAPSIWSTPYNVIRRANNLLVALKEGKAAGATEAQLNDLIGQALTVRALVHFDLARVYCYPYTKAGAPTSYGIPYLDFVPLASNKPGRSTLEETYGKVIKDLTDAIPLMSSKKNTGYLNKWGAMALLSRVYLYKGDNANALKTAEDVLTGADMPYVMWTNADYVGAWKKSGTSEVIWEIVNYNANDWTDREGLAYLISEEGYADYVNTPKLIAYFAQNPNDVRAKVNIASKVEDNIKIYGDQDVWCAKYPGNENATDFRVNNIPVLRISELYLNAAEAALKAGDQAKADKYLNDIIKRAMPDAAFVKATLDIILEQRAIEFNGEGQRFFDAMRNNLTLNREVRWEYPSLSKESQVFDNTYFRTILPIPKAERETNPAINEQQNDGY